MRRRIYEIIEVSKNGDGISKAYDWMMMCAIVISIVPLAFKGTNTLFYYVNTITVALFIVDYIRRRNKRIIYVAGKSTGSTKNRDRRQGGC